MRLQARITILAVTHIPASTYTGKDGVARQRAESWEATCRYADTAFSRAQKKAVPIVTEGILESRQALGLGDYDCIVQASVMFGEQKYIIAEASPVTAKAKN